MDKRTLSRSKQINHICLRSINSITLSPHQVTGSPHSQLSHQTEYQVNENNTPIHEEGDTNMMENTINLKKREVTSSTEKVYGAELNVEEDSIDDTEVTNNNKYTVEDVFNKGDLAIPYDSLGWFSKVVEVALDGSLYIGIAFGIMFLSASVLSGAIGIIDDTCLICAFIGYANTVNP